MYVVSQWCSESGPILAPEETALDSPFEVGFQLPEAASSLSDAVVIDKAANVTLRAFGSATNVMVTGKTGVVRWVWARFSKLTKLGVSLKARLTRGETVPSTFDCWSVGTRWLNH